MLTKDYIKIIFLEITPVLLYLDDYNVPYLKNHFYINLYKFCIL